MEDKDFKPSLSDFKALAAEYNMIQLYAEVSANGETPVSAFEKIDDGREAFLLESAESGDNWGRYSFLGTEPKAIIRGKGSRTQIITGGEVESFSGDPLDVLSEYLSRYKMPDTQYEGKFPGGAVGYIGYDMVRHFEKIPDTNKQELDVPDLLFMITDCFLLFDSKDEKIRIVCNVYIEDGGDVEAAYLEAKEKITTLIDRLGKDVPTSDARSCSEENSEEVVSNFPKEDFLSAVTRTKEYIKAGDIIQAVISQRFSVPLVSAPIEIYKALRVINPSPYMFFMRLDDLQLVGSSPEILVRVEDGEIDVRPIAGTRPRGKDEARDKEMEKELLNDPKERAEHIMLVDLGRNDVGRVAETGSVEVDEFMSIERYSHVMHIVSNVHGKMRGDMDTFDALRACFPAGTLSGAPKIRAMEIIEEMEPSKRGVYGGSVGWFGFNDSMDVCITIRTVLIKDGRAYVQAGAGIVADSDPECEYEETVNKAKGVLKAIKIAGETVKTVCE
jgi:anthranilate synthase component 1